MNKIIRCLLRPFNILFCDCGQHLYKSLWKGFWADQNCICPKCGQSWNKRSYGMMGC